MRAQLIASTQADLAKTAVAVLEYTGQDFRPSLEQSWLRNHSNLASAHILDTVYFISFTFLVEMEIKYALSLPNVRALHEGEGNIWIVTLSLEEINALLIFLSSSATNDYLDFLRFVVLQLDYLGYTSAIHYSKVTSASPFYMVRHGSNEAIRHY